MKRIHGKPYEHQVKAFQTINRIWREMAMELGYGAAALLMEMGTGKTLPAIAIVDLWRNIGEIKRVLVVAPLSVCPVWREEFAKFADFPYMLTVLEGNKKLAQLAGIKGQGLQIVVVNYESVWRLEAALASWKADLIICDESSRIKNTQAKQSKALHRLGAKAKYRLILTGTPVQNNPMDFFSQYKFLDPSILGKSFYTFRNRYAIVGGYGNHQIVGYKHLDELVAKVHSIAFRVTKEQALDLPEATDTQRIVSLEPSAMHTYAALERDAIAALSKGTVTAANVLTKLLRLSQVTGGFVRSDDGMRPLCISKAKLAALEEIVDDVRLEGRKLVIFARFIPEIDAICKMLHTKQIDYSIVRGDVKDRADQIRRFQEEEEVKVFVAQIQTAAMGITLTAASVAVFYSLDFNLANYLQCKARIHRAGQKNACTYIHLIAQNTIDGAILAALSRKEDFAKLLVDD